MDNEHKPSLLYIMGIDWDWIFQRPQIIERHLEDGNDVTVIFPRSILKLFARRKSRYPRRYKILWTLPLQEKIWVIGKLSRLLNLHVFQGIHEYDAVVVGYPLYYRYVPRSYLGILIYDCMDNYEALYPYRPGVGELLRQEKELVGRSSLVFASSQRLMEKLRVYCSAQVPRMELLRNGTDVPGTLPPISVPSRQERYMLGYFGTIAEWFDIGLLSESLRQMDNIEYRLIGPASIPLPMHPRLVSEGVVHHDALYAAVQPYACLVMPFLPNEAVLYVDPVKLYEYIVMGKCIIAVSYPEIERFEDFVYFYHSSEEYIRLLRDLVREGFPPKYTARQRQCFLEENSWQARFRTWDEALEETRNRNP